MLEAGLHSDNAFVTLSYDEENVPWSEKSVMTLQLRDYQLWMKKLRRRVAREWHGRKIRFYIAGEYGDEGQRPHYHVALFNFPACRRGNTLRVPGTNRPDWKRCCVACSMAGETWGKGDVVVGNLEMHSAQYICGYVIKKLTGEQAKEAGRVQEFCRMSNRPGIGADAMWEIASELLRYDLMEGRVDVPTQLQHGKKKYPLGRYLTQKLREYVGREKETPEEVLQELASKLRDVWYSSSGDAISLKQAILESSKGKRASIEARFKIFNAKRNRL